ncbi:MAG: hypothetical protein J6C17_01245 [Clostridia bacterium]|nr:hypothetical protein [Clostridia bacterium]
MKRIISILITIIILTVQGFAFSERDFIVDLCWAEGEVYITNPNAGTVVLKNLKTTEFGQTHELAVKSCEYTEVRAAGGVAFDESRNMISLDKVNENLLDKKVRVLISRSLNGYNIIYMRFLPEEVKE